MSYKGYVPERVIYVCKKQETEELVFDDTDENISIAKFKTIPAYPVEAGKKLDNAIKWTDLKKPVQVEFENTPIKNVRVCGLEERGNGGRAYKVLIDEKYYVDMREDVILETIINYGITKGGKLNGEYVWVKYGNNMKLVRHGSDLHKTFVKGSEMNAMAEITKDQLVVGGIYKTKKGDISLYLGQYHTYNLKYDEDYGHQRYSGTHVNKRLVAEKVYVFKNVHSFYYPKDNYKTCKPIVHFNTTETSKHYYYELKKSIPKFIFTEALVDFSGIDIPAEIAKLGVQENTKNKNQDDPVWMNCGHLCLGVAAPSLHPSLVRFNLPIAKK